MKKNKKIKYVLASVIMVVTILAIFSISVKKEEFDNQRLIAMYIQNGQGEYELKSDRNFPKEGYVLNVEKSSCKNGGTLTQNSDTKKISLVASNKDDCTLYFDKEVPKGSLEETLENLNIKIKTNVPNFSNVATTDETADGLFAMEDDYGMSYYYRGAANNNYVKFGTNANGEEMWWRIIRINGDGSLRIIFDGTASGKRLGLAFTWSYSHHDDAKYVGWMYGGAPGEASTSYEEATKNETNSQIKTNVDNWYVTNIKNTGYEKYLSDEIFCNDRSIPGVIPPSGYPSDTKLGYGKSATYYGAYKRLYLNKTPSFKCPQKNDMFTLKDGVSQDVTRGQVEGNKALDYPVGLITADEISAAGGVYGKTNQSYYLYQGTSYFLWSLSPHYASSTAPRVFGISHQTNIGALSDTYIYFVSSGTSPVINLSAEYAGTLRGEGTIDNPYRMSV